MSLRQVWAAAQGLPWVKKAVSEQNAEHSTIETGFAQNGVGLNAKWDEPCVQTAAKRKEGAGNEVPCWGLGIGVTRPLCGIQRDGNRKSQGALARLCEFPGISPPKSPKNPITPH